eukprot:jgi/Psemu1/18098/gm1.18098_g
MITTTAAASGAGRGRIVVGRRSTAASATPGNTAKGIAIGRMRVVASGDRGEALRWSATAAAHVVSSTAAVPQLVLILSRHPRRSVRDAASSPAHLRVPKRHRSKKSFNPTSNRQQQQQQQQQQQSEGSSSNSNNNNEAMTRRQQQQQQQQQQHQHQSDSSSSSSSSNSNSNNNNNNNNMKVERTRSKGQSKGHRKEETMETGTNGTSNNRKSEQIHKDNEGKGNGERDIRLCLPAALLMMYFLISDYPTTYLIHHPMITITAAANNTTDNPLPPPPPPSSLTLFKKHDPTFYPDASDKECLICVIKDFLAQHHNPKSSPATATANVDYSKNIHTFLAMFLPSNAFLIQQNYMLQATKPYKINCFTAARCLCLINILSILHLPRSNRTKLYPNNTLVNNTFYSLMLPTWQLKFNETGNQLKDASYKFQCILAFVEQLHHDAQQQLCQNCRKHQGNYNHHSQPPCPGTVCLSYQNNGNQAFNQKNNSYFSHTTSRPQGSKPNHQNSDCPSPGHVSGPAQNRCNQSDSQYITMRFQKRSPNGYNAHHLALKPTCIMTMTWTTKTKTTNTTMNKMDSIMMIKLTFITKTTSLTLTTLPTIDYHDPTLDPTNPLPTSLHLPASSKPLHLKDHISSFVISVPKLVLEAHAFKEPCQYNIILGRDTLCHFKIVLDFNSNLIKSLQLIVSMRTFPQSVANPTVQFTLFPSTHLPKHPRTTDLLSPNPIPPKSFLTQHMTIMMSALYVINANICLPYKNVFDGTLKHYADKEIHLDIDPFDPPNCYQAYPVLHVQLKLFKTNLDCLINMDLPNVHHFKERWQHLMSIQLPCTKQSHSVQSLSHSLYLGHPLLPFQIQISHQVGHISQYYTFVLDDKSKDLATITTPFEILEKVLRSIPDLEVYIDCDNITSFGSIFEDHLQLLDTILACLQDKGFVINLLKCKWIIKETNFLGRWLTPKGIKPWIKKAPPLNKTASPLPTALTFKKYRSMLLGAIIHIFTNHKNLAYKLSTYNTQYVLCWKLVLQEYNPTYHNIKGPRNLVTESLSCTPTTLTSYYVIRNFDTNVSNSDSFHFSEMSTSLMVLPSCNASTDSHHVKDSCIMHPCFDQKGQLQLDFDTIHKYQLNDLKILALPQKDPCRYFIQQHDTFDIVCHFDELTPHSPWKIVIPNNMLAPIVKWYHKIKVPSTGMDQLKVLL